MCDISNHQKLGWCRWHWELLAPMDPKAADTTTEVDSEGAGEGLAEAMSDVAQSCLAKKPWENSWKIHQHGIKP